MRLDKSDALFLYKVLFHYSMNPENTSSLSEDDFDKLGHLQEDLKDTILTATSISTEEEDSEEEEADEEEEEDLEEEEEEEVVGIVTASSLSALKAVSVTTQNGQKSTLEFEESGDTVDALLDGGSLIIGDVTHIKATDSAVELCAGDEWHAFPVKKLPKTWLSLLKDGLLEVVPDEEDE